MRRPSITRPQYVGSPAVEAPAGAKATRVIALRARLRRVRETEQEGGRALLG